MDVSVIIPTYNRNESVRRTLKSLAAQTMPFDKFEVIVVDDGSPDDTHTLANETFPFTFKYLRQDNQGATIARNFGARNSLGKVLIFIDDDITVSPKTLAQLAKACWDKPKNIAMGTLISRTNGDPTPYAQVMLAGINAHHSSGDTKLLPVECNTELLAVKRDDFFAMGMVQDPTHGQGWPNWDDVDFGYRAAEFGLELWQIGEAVGEHWDYSLTDFKTAAQRWGRAGKSAVLLFKAHPALRTQIPMLRDKMPIDWTHDTLKMKAKKILRQILASTIFLWGLETITMFAEGLSLPVSVRGKLYHLVNGSYMLKGFHSGLKDVQ